MNPPLTKAARHAAIAKALDSGDIRSQSQLQDHLRERGIDVTQATLSRDLEELGAVKVRGEGGGGRYALPTLAGTQAESAIAPIPGKLSRWCTDLLISAQVAMNQVVLRTPPGAAGVLAAVIDKESLPGVVGCVAGDDTILVVCSDVAAAARLHEQFLNLAGAINKGDKND